MIYYLYHVPPYKVVIIIRSELPKVTQVIFIVTTPPHSLPKKIILHFSYIKIHFFFLKKK
jgi:hypothetical protein